MCLGCLRRDRNRLQQRLCAASLNSLTAAGSMFHTSLRSVGTSPGTPLISSTFLTSMRSSPLVTGGYSEDGSENCCLASTVRVQHSGISVPARTRFPSTCTRLLYSAQTLRNSIGIKSLSDRCTGKRCMNAKIRGDREQALELLDLLSWVFCVARVGS